MTPSELCVRYRRVDESFEGEVVLTHDAEAPRVKAFHHWTFANIVFALHNALATDPELSRVVFIRRERDSLAPYTLEADLVELIRTDPLAAIQAMSPARQVWDFRERRVAEADFALPSGDDVQAETFGEHVYLRRKELVVECPSCGRFDAHVYSAPQAVERLLCHCGFVGDGASIERPERRFGWFVMATVSLLGHPLERFFLPRVWNDGGPWISRQALIAKHQKYLEEEENAGKHDKPPETTGSQDESARSVA